MNTFENPAIVTPLGLMWSPEDVVIVGDADYVSSTFVATDEDEAIEYAEKHGVSLLVDGTGKPVSELENSLAIHASGTVVPTEYLRLVEDTIETAGWDERQIVEAYTAAENSSVPSVDADFDDSPSEG